MVGDVNLCAPGEGRLDRMIGHVVGNSPLVDLLGNALADFQGRAAQGSSRVQHRGGRPHLLSSIDRVFMNFPAQTLDASAGGPWSVLVVDQIALRPGRW